MKVLHVIPTLAARYGGPVSVVKSLACAQSKAGHEVTICTTNADYPSGILRPPGTEKRCYELVEAHYFAVEFAPLSLSVGLARYLYQHIKRFDIVHIHGLYRFPSTFSGFLARKQGVPYLIRPHGSLDPYLYGKSSTSLPLKRLYERFLDFPNLQGASAIHYTAENERQLASYLDIRAPSFVVPNGIDWQPFENLPARGAFRRIYELGVSPVVLFLGRIHHKKGLDILVPAFAKVHRELPGVRLVIAGPSNDDYGAQVRSWVREYGLTEAVKFIDFITGPALVEAYVDADVFVLPSYTENFGMTVVEAMACELPVVISDRVNIHNEVSAARAGLITKCDPDEVAQSIMLLLLDPERRQELGANGRRFVMERYRWPAIVSQLSKEYMSIIEKSKPCQ